MRTDIPPEVVCAPFGDSCGEHCLSCDSQDVVVTAVKKSEDSDRVIVRLVEMNGKDTPLDITLFNEILHADVSHHEIYTMDEAGKELTLIEWDTCL